MLYNKKWRLFKIISLLYFLFFNFSQHCFAQSKRINNWYFGNDNNLDFSTHSPNVKSEGANTFTYANSTMSDTAGKLLFYTDGKNVYNNAHQIIPNGTGLKGENGKVIIVPFVRDPYKYYIFTVDGGLIPINTYPSQRIFSYKHDTVFAYSIVDMRLNNGKGAVTEKNTVLLKPAKEFMSVVKHGNNKDYWITVNKAGTNDFYTYLINECGIQKPVISKAMQPNPSPFYYMFYYGQMRFSPNGKFLMYSTLSEDNEQYINGPNFLMNFDNLTGILTPNTKFDLNYQKITFGDFIMSFTFSLNSKYLYCFTNFGSLLTYDLNAPNILLSAKNYKSYYFAFYDKYNLQTGPDGNIYSIRTHDASYLGDSIMVVKISTQDTAITNKSFSLVTPQLNAKKTLADSVYFGNEWIEQYYYVANGQFPRFVESYLDTAYTEYNFETPKLQQHAQRICLGNTVTFKLTQTKDFKTATWSINNGNIWLNTDSINKTFTYTFNKKGIYQIKTLLSSSCYLDTLTTTLVVDSVPKLQLLEPRPKGDTLLVCNDNPVTINAGSNFSSYLWQDGSTNQNFTFQTSMVDRVQNPVSVKVTVTNSCGSQTDSVTIKKVQLWAPNIITPNDDGKNESLEIKSPLNQPIHLQILNRWGQEVYQSDNYQNNWSAKDLTDGVYYFNSHYEGCPVLKGWLQVAR